VKLRLTCTGTRQLLMSNVQLASPLNGFARRLKELTDKRSKTVEDRMEIARVEFVGGLYWTAETNPYLPSQNLTDGARLIRAGMKISRSRHDSRRPAAEPAP
jgi:hypothetical protein